MSQTAVSILAVAIFLAIVGIDVALYRDRVKNNTFSDRARALGRCWPPARLMIALGMGLLLGHFWWTPQDVHDLTRVAPAGDAGPAEAPADAGTSAATDAGK